MEQLVLNGEWQFKCTKDEEWLIAKVPGTLYTDLLGLYKMSDPFYRENEEQVKQICNDDYEYKKTFYVEESTLSHEKVLLVCKGIDTVADIWVNGICIGHVENMHRTYKFDVKRTLIEGENDIRIRIYSPLKYIQAKDEAKHLWGVTSTVPGYQHIRKAHSSFGWDWGPKLPDMGIFRDIMLEAYSEGKIKDSYIVQSHSNESVRLDVQVELERLIDEELVVVCQIFDPEGECINRTESIATKDMTMTMTIENPQLWWPNGYGEQPLYQVEIELYYQTKKVDTLKKRIGLRTLTIKKEPDQWGESFCFEINGLKIFALGANYIPEDNLIGRNTEEKTKALLETCILSNFNCIRVWGGAYYAEDYFYDLCDEMGLIVWQDFMFACAVYELNTPFKENITAEIEDNIRRIRNHACLGLWCGNNEMELAWCYWGLPPNEKLRQDYLKMFEELIPELVRKFDPQTFYWPASPSSEGGFVEPNSHDKGDAHYWDVWHGKKPFEDFENYYFRFASEYGFQSFPHMKTIHTFAEKEDLNIYSPVMESHQKCIDNGHGNATIMQYMSTYYKYPTQFETILYASQILQGDCLKTAIEHWRRNRGRCMGSTYWQLNDCWPVASWATVDYYGRWKASQYYVKRAYAPLLLSAKEEQGKVSIYLTNDSKQNFKGEVVYGITNQKTETSHIENIQVELDGLTVQKLATIDCRQWLDTIDNTRNTYISYSLYQDNKWLSGDTLLGVKAKAFNFLKPTIKVKVNEIEENIYLTLESDVFARRVGLEFAALDVILEDNYFDLYPNQPRTIQVVRNQKNTKLFKEDLEKQLKITTVYDIS